MALIGVKNLGSGILSFARSLPGQTKTLLGSGSSIRQVLLANYLDYRVALTELKASEEWAALNTETRQQLTKQEELFIKLAGET